MKVSDKYKITFRTWNKVALLYEDSFMDLDLYNDSYDLFCHSLLKESSVLEIGCGPGNATKYILSKMPDIKLKGIDISPNMIALACKNNPNANFNVMDCRDIDQITKKYNAIFCGFCLPYMSEKDRDKFINDCRSLLQNDGRLYISFVEGKTSDSGYISGSTGDKMYFYYHELRDVLTELKENGFRINKIIHVPYLLKGGSEDEHTIIIADK